MPTDDQYSKWIEQAEAGSADAARWLIDELAQCLYRNEPIPEPLRVYFAPRLAEFGRKLTIKRAGTMGLTSPWCPSSAEGIVTAVIDFMEERGTVKSRAFILLSNRVEPSRGGEHYLGYCFDHIRTMFEAHVHDYAPKLRPEWYIKTYPEKVNK